jgi:hypothetical protein
MIGEVKIDVGSVSDDESFDDDGRIITLGLKDQFELPDPDKQFKNLNDINELSESLFVSGDNHIKVDNNGNLIFIALLKKFF